VKIVNPKGFPAARGYSNGILATGTRTMYVAGQIGWESDGSFASDDLVPQFARALDNVLAVVSAEGGSARQITQMTIYVLDVAAYRDARAELGRIWRERFGQYYPAMTLVEVRALVEPRARVEIQATAVLG
jgi:enamine deaminase RidA (YjgF/YER057c/UK114 family)